MDYSLFLPKYDNQHRAVTMFFWLKDSVPKSMYRWKYTSSGINLYFKYNIDLLAFRLRWGV